MKGAPHHPRSVAFLLAQVGGHASGKFAERLSALGLAPQHAGMLRLIHLSSGISQRALSSMLGLPPSRLVILVDELEARGLVERRSSAEDRRVYALHLTRKGSELLDGIGKVVRAHDDAICTSLTTEERETLGQLLRKIADQQGLTPGVHPGFTRLARSPSEDRDEGTSRRRKSRRQ
jgi:DNA-binding MarR family transcriptional regulator